MNSYFAQIDPSTLVPADDNPQTMPKAIFKALKDTIKNDNGMIDTPAVWKDGDKYRIISGHHRVKALVANKIKEESFKVFDDPACDEKWYRRRILSVNRTHGEPDEALLREFIHKSLEMDDIGRAEFFEGLGFDYNEINAYTADMDGDDILASLDEIEGEEDFEDVEEVSLAAGNNIKQVALFFQVSDYPKFMEMAAVLMKRQKTASLTDVVRDSVAKAYKELNK